MGADPKTIGAAAIAAALAAGGYVVYKVVKGEQIIPTAEDMKEFVEFIKNTPLEDDNRSSHENYDYNHDEFDQDGRIVFP